jgi:hypothetical protein
MCYGAGGDETPVGKHGGISVKYSGRKIYKGEKT